MDRQLKKVHEINSVLIQHLMEQEQCTFNGTGCPAARAIQITGLQYLQVLLELLQAGGIVQFEESRLIQMAEKAEL